MYRFKAYTSLMDVGVRMLRNELKRWLERARRGEEIVITERGRPIAKLVPASWTDPIDDLIRRGVATPPERPRQPPHLRQLVTAKGSASETVTRLRGR
jgi:prevent-host-death family protein